MVDLAVVVATLAVVLVALAVVMLALAGGCGDGLAVVVSDPGLGRHVGETWSLSWRQVALAVVQLAAWLAIWLA